MNYVYRITNVLLNKHYYGCRTANNPILDLGIKYFSSSSDKEFITDQKINRTNYKYKIIRTFDTRKEAISFEIKLHNRLDVGVNESFYNRAKQTSSGFDCSGRVYTQSQKDSMSVKIKAVHSDDPDIGKRKSISMLLFHERNPNRMSGIMINAHKLNPETAKLKRTARLSNLNCCKRAMEGIFITPYQNYVSLPHNVTVSEDCTMSHSNVRNWCKNSARKIVIQSAINNDLLTETDVGKTRKELGFYMVFPSSRKEALNLVNPIRLRLGLEAEL